MQIIRLNHTQNQNYFLNSELLPPYLLCIMLRVWFTGYLKATIFCLIVDFLIKPQTIAQRFLKKTFHSS